MTQNEQSYKKVIDDKKMILDQHMTTVMQEDPIYTRPHSKHFLMEAIARDSKFLADNGRIDYSLLIGLDDSKNEMVVGIVDYVRKFGLDKRFEMVSKTVKIYFQKTGSTQPADPRVRFGKKSCVGITMKTNYVNYKTGGYACYYLVTHFMNK